MALKVPLQKTTVRGPTHNKEKARSRTDCVVLRMDMVVMVMFYGVIVTFIKRFLKLKI